jgi:hypothetical protein
VAPKPNRVRNGDHCQELRLPAAYADRWTVAALRLLESSTPYLQPRQAVDKRYARRRRACRRGWRRRRGRRRIRPFPNVALITRPLGDIARARRHPVPGVANTHIPLDELVGPTPIHIQGIPWAPVIWPIPAWTKGTVASLGGTGAQAQTGYRDAASQHNAGNDPLQGAIGIHVVLPYSPPAAYKGCLEQIVRLAVAENMGHLTHLVRGFYAAHPQTEGPICEHVLSAIPIVWAFSRNLESLRCKFTGRSTPPTSPQGTRSDAMNAVPRVVLLAAAAIVIAGCGSQEAQPSQSSSGQPGDSSNGAGQSQYYQQGYASGTSGLARTGYADQLARPGATVPEMEHNACSAAINNESDNASINDADHPGNQDDYMNGCVQAFKDHPPPKG